MCEANAYIEQEGKEILYLEGVDIIIPEEKGLFMKNLFGEQRLFSGKIKEISLLKHKILLEENK
ncbi:MAG TPA: CooT family nickel-binding protein [Nitrospirae bacterium]|nr:CooT family nickel-binding protein [Nitrospirota bacterium]